MLQLRAFFPAHSFTCGPIALKTAPGFHGGPAASGDLSGQLDDFVAHSAVRCARFQLAQSATAAPLGALQQRSRKSCSPAWPAASVV